LLLQEIPELDEESSPGTRGRTPRCPDQDRKGVATSIFAAIKQDRVDGKKAKHKDSTSSTLESHAKNQEFFGQEIKRERKSSCTILEFMESKRKNM
jgi:hypothetical protein